jgi:hypothetical protein
VGAKKISALTAAATPLAGTEVVPGVQSGATVKLTAAAIAATGPGDRARGTAAGGETTLTLLHAVPSGKEHWVELHLNGVRQEPVVDYTCNGTTTLTLVGFTLTAGDAWWALHSRGY